MAELILTEAEKESGTYLDWDDNALGKLVRHLSGLMHDEYGRGAAWTSMAAHVLIDFARQANATHSTFELNGATVRGRPIGNWRVEIRKIQEGQ